MQFEFTSNVVGATFECRVSSQGNTFAPCASPALFMALTQGAHTVDVRALAGGQTDATPATATFTVDTTEPATVITGTPANATTTAFAGCSYTFSTIPSLESPPVTFQCLLDGAMPFVPCTNTFTCPNLPTGTHALEVFATDGAGNEGMRAFVGWEIQPSNSTIPAVQMGTVTINTTVRVTGRVTHVASNRLWVQSAEAAFAGVTVVPNMAPNPATLTPGRFVTAVGVVAEVNGETQLINAEVFAGAQQAAFNALDTNRDAAVLLQEQHEGVLMIVGGTTLAGGCGDADFCIRSCARTVPLIPAVLAPGVTMTTINDDGIFEGVLEATSATTFQLRVTNAFDQNDACL